MDREKGVSSHDDDGGVGEGEAKQQQQQQLLGAKLRKGISIGKRGGPCTPVPTWKLEEEEGSGPSAAPLHDSTAAATHDHSRAHQKQHDRYHHRASNASAAAATGGAAVSARKLGASLWEIQDLLPHSRMSRRGARLRHHKDEKLLDLSDLSALRPRERPQSVGSQHVAASLIQHRKVTDRNDRALQPVSPASYTSSMEVAAYNQAITPTSSLDLKGRLAEPRYSLKTSTELLKVLNHIWSLEEQHASNISLVKALKLELEHAQSHIQHLVQEKEADRHEIEDLMKQIAEDRLARKRKEQERIKAAVESIRDELEDERRLRRRSESLHRKLAKELSEVKSAFSKTLKDVEKEKKAHALLEELCDEFAKGVRDYEQEVRELKQKCEQGCERRCDRLVLHISEAWLDERLQMKLAEAQCDLSEKDIIIDRLTCEVETFLQARRFNNFNTDVVIQKDAEKGSCLRRHSLESIYLNGTVSAPQDAEDEDSIASDLHCFELNMGTNDGRRHDHFKSKGAKAIEKLEESRKSNATKKKMGYCERIKGESSSSLQLQLGEQMETCNGSKVQFMNEAQGIHIHSTSEGGAGASQAEVVATQKSENGESREGSHGIKIKRDCTHGSNYVIENPNKCESEFAQVHKIHVEDDRRGDSCDVFSWRGHSVTVGRDNASSDYRALSSPVQQWNYHHISPDVEISECSSKLPQGVKENTLKAKLLEARLEGQHARSKTSKGSLFGG